MSPLNPDSGSQDQCTIAVEKYLDRGEGTGLLEAVSHALQNGCRRIRIDFSGMDRLDSSGCAWLVMAHRKVTEADAELEFTGARGQVAEYIEMIRETFDPTPPPRFSSPGFLEILGGKGIGAFKELKQVCSLIVGSIYWSFIAPVEGRGIRWKGFFNELQEMGANAVGIVCLINLLLGLVIAMLSAAQLRLFDIQILVASGVVIGFARELAAVMTGIVVSARTGAAITAELATMVVSDEIDALKGMGMNVIRFLVAPKVLAILIAVPLLTVMAFLSGVAGGFLLGTFSLDFTFERWWAQTVQAVQAGDMIQGLVKSVFFALIIVIVGCHNGLTVSGGASEVGQATTRSVVMDIFFIIVADMIFATLFFFTT